MCVSIYIERETERETERKTEWKGKGRLPNMANEACGSNFFFCLSKRLNAAHYY
jgi:hypothetical protein